MKRMELICFTDQGAALAERLAERLDGWQCDVCRCCGAPRRPLQEIVKEAFAAVEALVFIGAAGIAVRAVAPHLQDKLHDPAVLVLDEAGQFVIPLLSGHIGGANRLARQLAETLGATAVITTASDVRGLVPVDEWAVRQGFVIANLQRVKYVAAKLLRGETVTLQSALALRGALPPGWQLTEDDAPDVLLSPYVQDEAAALWLIPPCVAVGVGCRRGVSEAALQAALAAACARARIDQRAICSLHSIDLKQDEPALNEFARVRGWPLITYPAQWLRAVQGSVSRSEFVAATVGVDNVCERAALAAGGRLILPKLVQDGVTVALVLRDLTYSFEEWL